MSCRRHTDCIDMPAHFTQHSMAGYGFFFVERQKTELQLPRYLSPIYIYRYLSKLFLQLNSREISFIMDNMM